METQIRSAVGLFEELEKLRRGMETRLSHLQKNRKCLNCNRDWMPRKYEHCPECGSENTRLMKRQRKCLDCAHVWEPSPLGVCPWCGSGSSEPNPKDDAYIRNIGLPRLRNEEEFYEGQMMKMVKDHPVWPWAEQVKGAGLTSVGRIIGRTDIVRLNTVSEMWAHCGLGLYKDGTRQRKRKGKVIDYDPRLQSYCVMLGESLLKQKGAYYKYYQKQRLIHAELTPSHSHNRSFRHMIKLFLSHLWQVWREEEGLSAPTPYGFAILKHPEGHQIGPWDMVAVRAEKIKKD